MRGRGKVCKLGKFTARGTGAVDSHQAFLKGLRENNDKSAQPPVIELNLLFTLIQGVLDASVCRV